MLSPAEAIPYRAGYRIGTAAPLLHTALDYDLAAISPVLTAAERAALAAGDDEQFTAWVLIGIKAASLINAVRVAREG